MESEESGSQWEASASEKPSRCRAAHLGAGSFGAARAPAGATWTVLPLDPRRMPVRYGRPPKRNRRSRRCRVANDDDVCVGMSTIGEDDVVAAAAVDDLEVRAGGAGAAHSLPPLPRNAGGGAASFAAGAAASAALLARTHVSRFDGGRYALDAASERGCLTAATDGGVAAAGGGDDAYAPGFDVVVAGRLRCTVREFLGAGSFGAVYRAAGPPRCGRRRDFALKAVRAADLAPARRRALERRLTTEAALSISLGLCGNQIFNPTSMCA